MTSITDLHADPAARLLADLVRIPSVNPMGRAVSGPEFSEAAVADHVATYLRRHSVDVQVDEVSPGRPNVTGYVDAGAANTIMLQAHLDTVNAEGMTVDPFGAEVKDGCLFGRGACDAKGSLATFLQALVEALKTPGALRHNIVLLATTDEEYKFTGARHAVRLGLRADFGIAGEPTSLKIIRAHKGVVRWYLRTAGTAAHAAYPTRGENAIYRMGHVLVRLETYARDLLGRSPHPLLGTPSLSVGLINGGQAVNIVPDRCQIEVDRRTVPGEDTETVLAGVAACLESLSGWEMSTPHLAVGGMDVPANAPVVNKLSDAIRSVIGLATVEGAFYATDAGIFNGGGIPTVVFGPGDIALAHTATEHIPLAELRQATDIVRTLLVTA
jgi:acetylornithine deacetylase/succinyl-diaminopimelate desuccinylase family protein